MIRGGVYRVNFGRLTADEHDHAFRGHEQRGKRYGVLVSPSQSPLSVVTLVPTSTSAPPGVHHPPISFGHQPTLALVEQTRAVDIRFVAEMVGFLSHDDMARVEHALANYLGLICWAD